MCHMFAKRMKEPAWLALVTSTDTQRCISYRRVHSHKHLTEAAWERKHDGGSSWRQQDHQWWLLTCGRISILEPGVAHLSYHARVSPTQLLRGSSKASRLVPQTLTRH